MSVCLSLQAKEILTKESNVQEVRFCTMADKKTARTDFLYHMHCSAGSVGGWMDG